MMGQPSLSNFREDAEWFSATGTVRISLVLRASMMRGPVTRYGKKGEVLGIKDLRHE